MPTTSHVLPPEVTLSGGIIYAVQGDIYALNAKTGLLLQHYDIEADSPPIIIDDIMYSNSLVNNTVQAAHTSDGSLLWRTEVAGTIPSYWPLTIDAGILYFSTYFENFVYALRTSDGSVLWRYRMDEYSSTSPTLDTTSQTLYISFTSGNSSDNQETHVLALHASDGSLLQRFSRADGYSAPIAIWNNTLYSNTSYSCIALNKTNGELLWQYNIERAAFTSAPIVVNSVVYLCYDQFRYEFDPHAEPRFKDWRELHLCALDAETGTLLWQELLSADAKTVPMRLCVDHNVLYTSSEGTLMTFQASTGVPLWTYQTNGESLSTPIVEENVVYVGVNDGNVCALDASTGTLLWQTFVSTAVSMVAYSDVVVTDTTVRIIDPGDDPAIQIIDPEDE